MKQHQPPINIHFSPREQQIVALMMKDYSPKLIALQLHISKDTVDTVVKHLREKLGCHTSPTIVAIALTNGFVLDFTNQLVYYHHRLIG